MVSVQVDGKVSLSGSASQRRWVSKDKGGCRSCGLFGKGRLSGSSGWPKGEFRKVLRWPGGRVRTVGEGRRPP